jgi:predicted dehydrogenase
MTGLGIVGYGNWGASVAEQALALPELELRGVCEVVPTRASRCRRSHRGVRTCLRFQELLDDPRVDALAISAPPATGPALVRHALRAGKHVLLEKTLARTTAEAEALVALAAAGGLVLMPGHTALYSPAVDEIGAQIASGELGDVHCVTSSRMSPGIYELGLHQADGVIEDLAPHDIAVLLHWLGRPVTSVATSGSTVFPGAIPETAFIALRFDGGPTASVSLSWLAPRSVSQTIVAGTRCVVEQEIAAEGDVPLRRALEDFGRAVGAGTAPRLHAQLGLEVVRILEAAHASLASGTPVALGGAAQPRRLAA